MHRRSLAWMMFGTLALAFALGTPVWAAGKLSDVERQKIEALLKRIEGMTNAKFIRNGSEHDNASAAKFLRKKWERDDSITTAVEFIERAATKSSTTGKPYQLKLKDGSVTESAEFLRAELKTIESGAKP